MIWLKTQHRQTFVHGNLRTGFSGLPSWYGLCEVLRHLAESMCPLQTATMPFNNIRMCTTFQHPTQHWSLSWILSSVKKYGPRIPCAETPQHTMTFSPCNHFSWSTHWLVADWYWQFSLLTLTQSYKRTVSLIMKWSIQAAFNSSNRWKIIHRNFCHQVWVSV